MRPTTGALRGLSIASLAIAFLTLCLWQSPQVKAGISDLESWGNNTNGTVLRVTGSGILAPASTIGVGLGNATHRFAGSYINTGGATAITGNTTLTATNVGLCYLTAMTNNHTITLPTAALAGAGAHIPFVIACNNVGVTGNLTFAVTSSGNINGADTLAVTNTSGSTGNVSRVDLYSDGSAWFGGVTRK